MMKISQYSNLVILGFLISFSHCISASADIKAAISGYCVEPRTDPASIQEIQTGRIKPTNRNYKYSFKFPSLGVTAVVSGESVHLADTGSAFSVTEKVLTSTSREVYFNGFAAKARFNQPDSPGIKDIKISGNDGWLHIYGNDVNYAVQVIRENGTPRFKPSRGFPSLTGARCAPGETLYGPCRGHPARYSESLQRTFIEGFKRSRLPSWFHWFDSEPESIEVNGGEFKALLNSEGKPLYYVADTDFPKAVILRDSGWNPYIYDGSTIQQIEGAGSLSTAPKWAGTRGPRWGVQSASALGKTYLRTKTVWFELIDGRFLKAVPIPEPLQKGWVKRLSIPGSKESWIFTIEGLFIQSGDEFGLVARTSTGRRIFGPAKIGLTKSGDGIAFSSSDLHFKDRQHYVLRRSEASQIRCPPIGKVLPR